MKFWDTCVQALREERGAYLVLIAAILPLIFGFVGLAVDLGNYQGHSAKLQHASDAAALAGAAVYAANGETASSHPYADEAAEKYLKANLGSGEFAALVNTGNEIRYQVQTDANNISYYRVYIKENLDTSFIRLIGAPFFTYPQGEAIATIPIVNKETDQITFGNLFSFDGKMVGNFNGDNGNQVHSTFDGNIYSYNPGGFKDPWRQWCYSQWDIPKYEKFYTGDARNLNPNDAISAGYYKTMQSVDVQIYNTFTREADKALKKIFANELSVINNQANQCTLPPNNTSSNYYLLKTDCYNLDIELHNFPGDQNQPVYIYIDEGVGHMNINLREDITRPIIFCYTAGLHGNHGGRGDISFSSNNHDFRGVVYAPYASTYLNFETSTFNGSVITHDLTLNSNHGKFIFEEFGIPISDGSSGSGGSGGSSGSGSSGTSVDLKLVPDPGLGWNT